MLKSLLAMMITVAPPGQSAYSVVVEPSCGSAPGKLECDITPKPTWSPSYKAYVRKETKEEALQRYIVIARAIQKVAGAMAAPQTAPPALAPQKPEGGGEAAAWPYPAEDLARALVTIAHHESSFRRDVHSGVGPAALGDCAYWDVQGRRVSPERARTTPGVLRTSCQSVCLVQINTGGLDRARFGFMGKEMVGLDDASTERCFTAGARAFAEARARCAQASAASWFGPSVASYMTGDACETAEEWMRARTSTFDRIGKITEEALPKDVRALLGAGVKAADAPLP
jgi:hypothetical protein